MVEIKGILKYLKFAPGTKSESLRSYICANNGTRILVRKLDDNPFENKGFKEYENHKLLVKGELIDGVLEVTEIIDLLPESNTVDIKENIAMVKDENLTTNTESTFKNLSFDDLETIKKDQENE